MSKVNFTSEHRASLEKLFLDLSFSGEVINGKFGAGVITPYDALHNSTVNTLKAVHAQLKSSISAKENDNDEWTNSEYDQRQLNLQKKWLEFIHLVIGYKRFSEEKAKDSKELRELEKQLAEMEAANKTPEEKIKELKDTISKMKGETPASESIAP